MKNSFETFLTDVAKEKLRILENIKNLEMLFSNDNNLLDEYRDFMKHNAVCGGSLVSLLQRKPVNDIDVFIIKSPSHYADSFLQILNTRKIPEHITGVSTIFDRGSTGFNYTALNNVTKIVDIDINQHHIGLPKKIQMIYTDYTSYADLINDFDFRHCKIRLEYMNALILSEATYNDIMNKRLVLNRPLEKIGSGRIEKFKKLGYIPYQDIGTIDNTENPWYKQGWSTNGTQIQMPDNRTLTQTNGTINQNITNFKVYNTYT